METKTIETQRKPATDPTRKRALAAVCQYLEELGSEEWRGRDAAGRIEYAKEVLCRAARAGSGHFNRIGEQRLRGLTAMFNRRRRDMEGVTAAGYEAMGQTKGTEQ